MCNYAHLASHCPKIFKQDICYYAFPLDILNGRNTVKRLTVVVHDHSYLSIYLSIFHQGPN